MEIYDPNGLFEFDGKSLRLKNDSEGLEMLCKLENNTDIFGIRNDEHKFRFCVERNRFSHKRENNISSYFLIDDKLGIESVGGYFCDEDKGFSNNHKMFAYGIFGYLSIDKNIILSKLDSKLHSEFLKDLSARLHYCGISAPYSKIYDDKNFRLICSGRKDKAKCETRDIQFSPFRKLVFNRKDSSIFTFKYISHQYNKLQPDLVSLDLRYLSETENALLNVSKNTEGKLFIKDKGINLSNFCLSDKTALLEAKFKEIIEEELTYALSIHESEISNCMATL